MTKALTLILLLGFGSSAYAQDDFQRFFGSLDTLSAQFSQRVVQDDQQIGQTTLGSLVFQRPQQLLWHTSAPVKQTLLVKDTRTWLIDYELEQASLGKLESTEQTPLYWLSTPYQQLQNRPAYSHSHQGIDWYSTGIESEPNFGFKNGVLHLIGLTNTLGQKLWLELTQLNSNTALDQQQFTLEIPADFDVIKSF